MKHLKHLLAAALTMLVAIAVATPALADPAYSITVDNAVNGETYTAYKVFDVTYAEANADPGTVPDAPAPDNTHQWTAYAYKISTSSQWWGVVTNGAAGTEATINANGLTFTKTTTAGVYNVAAASSFDAATFAALLDANKTGKAPAATGVIASGGSATIALTEAGYYFVDTTMGSLCSLDTTEPTATIREKNTVPEQDKKQAIDAQPETAAGYADTERDVQVGDTVWYQIEVKDGKGTDAAIKITDEMTSGLTYNNDAKVYKVTDAQAGTEQEVTAGTGTFTHTKVSDQKFTVEFAPSYVSGLAENDVVYIRFSATVNSAAATDIKQDGKETNTSTIEYSEQSSSDSVKVQTYKFQLDKTKNAAKQYADLLGAKFELYRGSVADANKIHFLQGTAEGGVPVIYVVPASTTGAFTEIQLTADGLNSTKVIIKGLDKDTYVLRETAAPDGYNIAEDQTVVPATLATINGTITDVAASIEGDVAVQTVINNEGTELPSTGGIGTTLFYVIGGAMVITAGVVLVTKRRMAQIEG